MMAGGGPLPRHTAVVMVPGLGLAFAAEVAFLAEIQPVVMSIGHVGLQGLLIRANVLAHFTDALWVRGGVEFLMLIKRSFGGGGEVTMLTSLFCIGVMYIVVTYQIACKRNNSYSTRWKGNVQVFILLGQILLCFAFPKVLTVLCKTLKF